MSRNTLRSSDRFNAIAWFLRLLSGARTTRHHECAASLPENAEEIRDVFRDVRRRHDLPRSNHASARNTEQRPRSWEPSIFVWRVTSLLNRVAPLER